MEVNKRVKNRFEGGFEFLPASCCKRAL